MPRTSTRILLVATFPPALASPACGQEAGWIEAHFTARPDPGPLETDRPDFTEGPTPVARGWTQLESGYTLTHDDAGDGDASDHTFPELLLRHGLFENVELRIGWDGFSATRIDSPGGTRSDDGFTDMSVGFKTRFHSRRGALPDLSAIVEISIPTGADSKSSGRVDPALKLIWAYELTDAIALAGNLNFAGSTGEDGRFFQFEASVALGLALSERWGGYVEYFGIFPGEEEPDRSFFNGGLTFLISDNLQLDARAGLGLNREAEDLFVGAGLSWRF